MSSMLQPDPVGAPDAGDIVIGVDTHKDVHVVVVLTVTGVLLGSNSFPTTAAGYRQLLTWARSYGDLRRAGVECTGSYGAALTRYMLSQGITVIEVAYPDKATRRRRGKTDVIDAESAARAVISGSASAMAKTTDGPAEMIRMFKLAKNSALKARTQAINQLKAVLVGTDPALRESMAGLGPKTLLRRCAALAIDAAPTDTAGAAAYTLRLLARRILTLTEEIDELQKCLAAVITHHHPQLLERSGVGPDNAATLLITAGDNPQRLRSERSFAALCGASPVDASSGRTSRRRLNRGGDRQANAALYRIVLSRLHTDPETRAYRDRRLSEGKTKREIIRCLKRYVAREIYTLLQPTPA
ncbi:IS110 family transposase [Micromonospora polyrhachis]|uniref:Transposase n=1 Tax=Micromonospora polyrhachis TaxID=1282883 RepID=A0A7W7SSR4_9ACTN|nr:IS110 family transposase [Micromonospora polyrhachis]MBB4960292.1 transposase [Micromonospora polyrhachis]